MPDDTLTPVPPDDLRTAIGYALRFHDNGKPHRLVSGDMAALAADVIAKHLALSGFVVMRKPPAPPVSVGYSRTIPLKP